MDKRVRPQNRRKSCLTPRVLALRTGWISVMISGFAKAHFRDVSMHIRISKLLKDFRVKLPPGMPPLAIPVGGAVSRN